MNTPFSKSHICRIFCGSVYLRPAAVSEALLDKEETGEGAGQTLWLQELELETCVREFGFVGRVGDPRGVATSYVTIVGLH